MHERSVWRLPSGRKQTTSLFAAHVRSTMEGYVSRGVYLLRGGGQGVTLSPVTGSAQGVPPVQPGVGTFLSWWSGGGGDRYSSPGWGYPLLPAGPGTELWTGQDYSHHWNRSRYH